MELPACKYLVHFHKNGKVFDQEICDTEDQVRVLQALARRKNYETEVSYMNLETKKGSPASIITKKIDIEKETWEKRVVCIETGEVFPSIRECSRCHGIIYKSLYNAIKSGMPRKGLHFVYYGEDQKTKDMKIIKKRRMPSNKNSVRRRRKLLCTTTGKVYNSVTEMLASLPQIPVNSFYRCIRANKPIKGLLFQYV